MARRHRYGGRNSRADIGVLEARPFTGGGGRVAVVSIRPRERSGNKNWLVSHSRLPGAALAATVALPGAIHRRRGFIEQYNVLDYSPKVRSLRSMPPFTAGRVPLLYTMDVSDPAVRFYLAHEVETIDQAELEHLPAENQPFLCFTFKWSAVKFFQKHSHTKLGKAAFTSPLRLSSTTDGRRRRKRRM